MTEALKTGRNQNEAKDSGDIFAALYADPDKLRGFLAAMSGVSLGAAQAIADKFPWRNYKSFADIGAAQGMAGRESLFAFQPQPVEDVRAYLIASLNNGGKPWTG